MVPLKVKKWPVSVRRRKALTYIPLFISFSDQLDLRFHSFQGTTLFRIIPLTVSVFKFERCKVSYKTFTLIEQ